MQDGSRGRHEKETGPLNAVKARARLDARNNFFTVRVAESRNNLPELIKTGQ